MFHILNDTQVILRSRGVFYQKKVYYRGGGYIRLGSGDATGNPNVSWEELDGGYQLINGVPSK